MQHKTPQNSSPTPTMADHFARFSSMLESARDLTIEAAVSASTRLTETPSAKRPQEISKLLNSRNEREVLSGMKCVISLVSRGEDGVQYFADVVKNVTLLNPRVRALVMVYIQKYAEREPDTALLSINSIQKALGDKSPRNRAASIRTLGGIQIPEIASLLILCIRRTVMDPLPIVRAATALAIGKAYEIEGVNRKQLLKDLLVLLGDALPVVVGPAIKVFMQLKLAMAKSLLASMSMTKIWTPIHSNFRMYVRMLAELDAWSMAMMIDLLVEYARRFLPRPTVVFSNGTQMDLPGTAHGLASLGNNYSCTYDPDLSLFLLALEPMSHNDSPQVVLASLRALILLGTPRQIIDFGFPDALVRSSLLATDALTRLYSLQCISVLALASPEIFRGHTRKFFISGNDSSSIAECKIYIMLCLFAPENGKIIMLELKYNAFSQNVDIARAAVKAIGRCSQTSPEWADKVLRWCIAETTTAASSPVMAELLTVIRYLLQQKQGADLDENQLIKTLYKLSVVLSATDQQADAAAKSSIIWIIGEFTEATKNLLGPDVVRRSLKSFVHEPEKVRYELLMLAAKSYLYEIRTVGAKTPDSIVGKMFHHIVHLCRYDSSFATRDRVRMLEQLFEDVDNHQLATLFLQVPKPAPVFSKYENSATSTLSAYLISPEWADPDTLPPKTIRKETTPQAPRFKGINSESVMDKSSSALAISSDNIGSGFSAPISAAKNQLQSLDEFFGNEEESEESHSESESDEDTSEENEDSEEESDEEETEQASETEAVSENEYLSSEESDESDDSEVALVQNSKNGKASHAYDSD